MTRLGLLSDSHGDAAVTRRAVGLLLAAGADRLIHLGDVGTAQVLDALAVVYPPAHPEAGQRVPAHVVFGNTDYDEPGPLARYAQDLGLAVDHPAGHLTQSGRSITFTHGHLSTIMDQAVHDGRDYLLHGHTHLAADRVIRSTRVINPGALTRARPLSVAVLDPGTGSLQTLVVPGKSG